MGSIVLYLHKKVSFDPSQITEYDDDPKSQYFECIQETSNPLIL